MINMAGNGPPPKPEGERRRRNASVAMTRLPAEGRKKRAPNWPLVPDVVMATRRDLAEAQVVRLKHQLEELEAEGQSTVATERKLAQAEERLAILTAQLAAQRGLEAELWKRLWSTPQSVEWERLDWTRDVAQYVRHKVLGELGELDHAKEARQWSDRLGLTPASMLRLRWEVAADEVTPRRTDKAAAEQAGGGARQRLRIVDAAG